MQVDFWQLSRDPLENVVAQIAKRTLDAGQRMLVVADSEAVRSRIDKALWEFQPEAFLAHGAAGSAHEERQPILLGTDCKAANGAQFVVLADGIWRDEALEFDRAFLLFGEERLQPARDCWRALGQKSGLERQFYRQDGGKWVKVA